MVESEGWWIPGYLAESNPELKTIEGVLANPVLVGGRFHNCPEGWGCRIANDNYKVAFEFEKHGMEVFDHGSGETLGTSIAEAYASKKPGLDTTGHPQLFWVYPMFRVDVGPYIEEVHACAQKKDCGDTRQICFCQCVSGHGYYTSVC